MEHYNGRSGTYFSFLPVHNIQSAGYECLLGAIEMGYRVDGFLIVNENTLVNSWNFGNELDLTHVWHGNEHAINVTSANLNTLDTEPNVIMESMWGIWQAFQFLENVLFSDKLNQTSSNSQVLIPPPLVTKHDQDHHREKRDESEESEDYSVEEMKMMHDYEDESEEHEMSVVDDHGNSTKPTHYHINLFGDLAENEPDQESDDSESPKNVTSMDATELLFHPNNFKKEETEINHKMTSDHFNGMMVSIQSIYKRIDDKLKLWTQFRKLKMEHSHHHGESTEEMREMEKELEFLNCKTSSNAEICHVVAKFFSTLDSNEGDSFQLIYDDLPIYYVPESLKQRAFLFANIFTK